jgi:hypothetical protein
MHFLHAVRTPGLPFLTHCLPVTENTPASEGQKPKPQSLSMMIPNTTTADLGTFTQLVASIICGRRASRTGNESGIEVSLVYIYRPAPLYRFSSTTTSTVR